VNALANDEVGKYFKDNFVSSYQKVGTFRIVNNQKQGGNVASYFTLPDGSVLHVVAGPVDAATLLREARWVVDTRKLAIAEAHGDSAKYKAFFSKAHADRLLHEHGMDAHAQRPTKRVALNTFARGDFVKLGMARGGDRQGRIHLLLANYPLARTDDIYRIVFEQILGERVSTLPVIEVGKGL
jgi:hypothetical protein